MRYKIDDKLRNYKIYKMYYLYFPVTEFIIIYR